MRVIGFALVSVIALASPAIAQQSGCAGFKWPIDREQAAFAGSSLPTINSGTQIPGVMEGVNLRLARQDSLTFDVAPTHKPRNTPAFGGIFGMVPIQVAGAYQVTLSDGAWIDVVQNGKALQQTGFTDSHDCPTVRKSVRFNLAAGPVTILVTDAAKDTLKLDVLPPPP